MPSFGKASQARLDTCHPDLKRLFEEVVKTYDCSILEGHRDRVTQDSYYIADKSKVRFPFSKHNRMPSEGVDVAPYPIDWDNLKRFYHFAGYVKAKAETLGINIRWGGDWDTDNDFEDQDFNDLVHFELRKKKE